MLNLAAGTGQEQYVAAGPIALGRFVGAAGGYRYARPGSNDQVSTLRMN